MPRRKPIIALTQEEAERQGALIRAGRRRAKEQHIKQAVVTGVVTGDDWEYIIKRTTGLSSVGAVIALAEDRGEEISRAVAANRAADMEKRLARQIEQQQRNKVMSDEDFEAWTRMKVEQLVATPTPNSQGVIRAIQFLKKSRDEGKARNPIALMKQVMECAERLHELDVLEEKAIKRGLKEAPVDGEHGSL